MPEIYNFRIDQAEAFINTADGNRRMTVHLTYPRNPQVIEKRLPENLQRGIEVFSNLTSDGYSTIGPIKPAASGSLYAFSDGKILIHRRDSKAPTHKMMHSAYAGFAATKEQVYTSSGFVQNGLRETSEEVLLTKGHVPIFDEVIFLTREDGSYVKPRLIVPTDSREYTTESARRLGLELKPLEVPVDIWDPTDTLIVTDEDGELIFRAKAFIEFIYESQTSLNALQIRQLPFSSEELLPVDAEGFVKDGGEFVHFNRESYIIDPKDIAGRGFGYVFKVPRVYKTEFIDGPDGKIPVPRLQKMEDYKKPYLGPDLVKGTVEVTDPHVWAPEDLLRRALDALGVEGYANKWMELELMVEQKKLSGTRLLPDRVLAKDEQKDTVDVRN